MSTFKTRIGERYRRFKREFRAVPVALEPMSVRPAPAPESDRWERDHVPLLAHGGKGSRESRR